MSLYDPALLDDAVAQLTLIYAKSESDIAYIREVLQRVYLLGVHTAKDHLQQKNRQFGREDSVRSDYT